MKSWRDPSEKTLALLLLAPAFFLIALIVIYPVGKLIYTSFFDMQLSGGARALEFVGLRNFEDALKDKEFWHAARNTLLITVVTVPGALIVGLGLALLATVRSHFGSLDAIKRVVKVLGMVNSAPDFLDHPKVINGCSELFAQVFGDECGIGARSAVGMGPLPGNIAVEIEVIFELA